MNTNYPQAERAIIGCALTDSLLTPDLNLAWFDDPRLHRIADTIKTMYSVGKPINFVTSGHELRGMDGYLPLLNECVDACPSPVSWDYWSSQLNNALVVRQILAAARAAINAVETGGEPMELLENYEREALVIRRQIESSTEDMSLRDAVRAMLDAFELGAAQGIKTGFNALDGYLSGMKPGQLIILAARPSVGKTSMAVNVAEYVAFSDLPVGIFSLEMSSAELVERLIASRGQVNTATFRGKEVSQGDLKTLTTTAAQLVRCPLHICDRGGLTLAQLASRARRMVQQHGIKLFVVDYLGLLRCGEKGRSRYEETSLISAGLKTLAKELRVPVLCLAQLNRSSEREDREPRLSDLRDSGSIEQDADAVLLLHRDGYNQDRTERMKLKIEKNRGGPVGVVNLLFHPMHTRFESLSSVFA